MVRAERAQGDRAAGQGDGLGAETPLLCLSPRCVWVIPDHPGTLRGVMRAMESNSCPGMAQRASECG